MSTVKARLPKPRGTSPAPGADAARWERRVLLPSNRVAVFRVPNVGEFLELRAEAMRGAEAKSGGQTPSDLAVGLERGRLLLRRQLIGLTAHPVDTILKAGVDLVAARAKAEAESAELVAQGKFGLDVEGIVEAAEDAGEDAEAMKAAARPLPVHDVVWNEHEGPVGEYLAGLPTSGLDTPEGADWQALNDYATLIMPQVVKGLDIPKAQRPRIRSLR